MKTVLLAFFVLIVAGTFVGGFYALREADTRTISASPQTEATEVKVTAPGPIRHMNEPRNVWVEPRRKTEEFNAPQPRPKDLTPEPDALPMGNYFLPEAEPQADTSTIVLATTCSGQTVELNHAEKQMLALHNAARAERGLGSLCLLPEFMNVARAHTYDMLERDFYGHGSPEGDHLPERLEQAGYGYILDCYGVGENIDADPGYEGTPAGSFAQLMNSPGHRANILDPDYEQVGIGAATGTFEDQPGIAMYTMVFGNSVC